MSAIVIDLTTAENERYHFYLVSRKSIRSLRSDIDEDLRDNVIFGKHVFLDLLIRSRTVSSD